MATAIFFGGRRLVRPGAYSQVDATGLSSVAPASTGIVALLGMAEGGKPLSVDPADSDHTRPETVLQRYRSGDLRTAGVFCFQPANDPAVPGGAQSLVCVKVNPATQATATLTDVNAVPSVLLTSKDYGAFTNQINVQVANGTDLGKLITVKFEDQIETFDDVGGIVALSIAYPTVAGQWGTVTGEALTTGIRLNLSRALAGLSTQRTADMSVPGTVTYVSTSAGDTGKVTLYGIASGVPVFETVTLTGTVPVVGVVTFDHLSAAKLSAVQVGTINIKDTVGPTTLFTFAPSTTTRGLASVTSMPVNSALAVTADVYGGGNFLVVRGKSTTNLDLAAYVDLSAPPAATAGFSQITSIELAGLPVARTATIAGNFLFSPSTYPSLTRLINAINGLTGFTAATAEPNPTTFSPADFDRTTAPIAISGTTGNFSADLMAFVNVLNTSSAYVGASRIAPTSGVQVPANTVAAVFLSGAIEGVTTITQWTTAFNLLKKRRVNIIVPLSGDPAIHSLLLQHLILRAGQLRSEANGYVGLTDVTGALPPPLSRILTLITALQNRNLSCVAQSPARTDPDTGLSTFYQTWMAAVIAAGMQAGSTVGEPLTRKLPLLNDFQQDASWNPEDNGDALIDAGLMFLEKVDNIGIRWVRSVTSYLADDNVAFSEMSANASANNAVFRLRTALDKKVGSRGLRGTVAAIKSMASDELGRMVDDESIVAYRALSVEQVADVFPVSVEIAPVLPVNFIPIVVHLVAASSATT